MAILTELKDPRVRGVTVTGVEMSGDMRQARVFVSIMGDETERRLVLHGLRSSAGFLQSRIAEEIDTRYTPRLEFVEDEGVRKQLAVARILDEWKREPQHAAEDGMQDEEAIEPQGNLDEH
jgi:ribosome-binding factor A